MKSLPAQWRGHQRRWQRFHRWEETLSSSPAGFDPSERLRWCEEALTFRQRFFPDIPSTLDAEQIRHWCVTRRNLPRRLPRRHGSA